MSPKTGRPVDGKPKDHRLEIRVSLIDKMKLEYCCNVLNLSKSDVVREGINLLYQQVNEK